MIFKSLKNINFTCNGFDRFRAVSAYFIAISLRRSSTVRFGALEHQLVELMSADQAYQVVGKSA
jgi:hypothetical protein